MSNNHEVTLAMIEEKLEKLEKDKKVQEGLIMNTKATLERQQGEMKLIDYSIKELENSKSCLVFDSHANKVEA